MKIFLATDHAGFELKESVKTYLLKNNYDIEDCGALTFDKNDDYPDFIKIAAEKTAANPESFGIVFGKSGTGEMIAANKVNGIRCALGVTEENVKLAREHNNANMLSLGSAFVSAEKAFAFIKLFVETPFSGDERHVRRIEKIKILEQENY